MHPDLKTLPAPEAAPADADESLVARALGGDRGAFETLVRRHQRPLLNHLYRMLGGLELARDLLQEVFIKVYVNLDSFDPRFRFTTWLYRIASNCAIDHQRKKKLPVTPLDPPDRERSGAGRGESCVAGHEPDPLEVLRLKELQGRLETAVAGLPPSYRQLILLRHRHHLRYDEIARATGLPLGTVKNRIFRAREILRRDLADVLEPAEEASCR